MSSVEIVEVINAMREPGRAELAHRTFMEKVRNHPGITAQNFLHSYLGGNGKQEPCYYLPKREAELMVMSESLAVQTKVSPRCVVYDRISSHSRATRHPKEPRTLPSWHIPTSTATDSLYGLLSLLPSGHSSLGRAYVAYSC
jgi:hypothetical protein